MAKDKAELPPPTKVVDDGRNKYPPATKAGDVFKEVYETTLHYMHPEDALHTSFEATLRYLENIGATRTKKKPETPEIKVKNPGREVDMC